MLAFEQNFAGISRHGQSGICQSKKYEPASTINVFGFQLYDNIFDKTENLMCNKNIIIQKESKSVGLEKKDERDGEWELERLLLKWGKSGYPHLQG